jgi:hypothetical protein
MIDTMANAMATTQNTTKVPRIHAALAAEKPIPVTTVSHAARHRGHFGNNISIAPGTIDAAVAENRRASQRDTGAPVQHCPVIAHSPRLPGFTVLIFTVFVVVPQPPHRVTVLLAAQGRQVKVVVGVQKEINATRVG